MASVTSLRVADPPARLLSIAQLRRRLTEAAGGTIPLLVVRLPALERTAWREGLRKARMLEKQACAAFTAAAGRALRAEDTIAHDAGSDIFMAALTAPIRAAAVGESSIDARSALARISASMESATRLEVDAGWTTFVTGENDEMLALIERGLQRGAQERERYAFFSALGHELRTPLASIRGYLETLLDETIDEPTRVRFLSIAHNESLRLSRLVEGMFEISLLDLHTSRSDRDRRSGSLDRALNAAIDACAASAAARAIRVRHGSIVPMVVDMDADRLTHVLINLIDNAVKHGRPGGLLVIDADLSDPSLAVVTIDDDGPGVALADRERIFALGERGETLAPGSGIGLALVRLMLERIGGRVDVSGSPLGGARFRVQLPRPAAR